MKKVILVVAVLAGLTANGFSADPRAGVLRNYSRQYHAAQKRCGSKEAPGRNIRKYGLKGDREPRKKHYIRSTQTLTTMCRPVHTPAAPVAPTSVGTTSGAAAAPPAAASSGVQSGTAQCESGGNPAAVDPSGKYRGKWQFDQQTWNAYAPSGYKGADPAAAPEAVQDQAAAAVPYDAWPNC